MGAGGNGSIFLTHLCRIHQAWIRLGGESFSIDLYDPDKVSEANLARQVYCEADIGQPKANVLAQRLRGFFDLNVTAHVDRFTNNWMDEGTVVVGCVDNLDARRKMARATRSKPGETPADDEPGNYWLDLGNGMDSGQVVLGGHGLPTFFDLFPEMMTAKDRKDLPSCSMAESLSRQDLFINSTIATLAGQLLWQLMRHGSLNHHGFMVNLKSGITSPIKVGLPA